MDSTRLAPEPASGEKKQQAMQDAKDMYKHTVRTCERLKIPVPPYDFLELIGKGGSGRVYKCRDRNTGDLVAVKIVDVDSADYTVHALDRDDTMKDFQKEVAILQTLKESKAQNINIIHNTYEVGQHLWIVSDYCTGGSVRTLMRALPPGRAGLEENFVIPIARELLVALVGLHSLGIIHRDIKATNVYITETGALQLGDYGVVGVTDEQSNKRKTILGTPHWMPRELLSSLAQGNEYPEGYGSEIDIWAFGCTLFEMATGAPPYARTPQQNLPRALLKAPRLEGEQYSEQLRDFIAFCLQSDPQQRPTAQAALDHPYVANTQRRYPTSGLVKLIEKYKLWEIGGGVRASLFIQGGAADIPTQVETENFEEDDADDWNFSTSDTFDVDFERRYSHMLAVGTQDMDLQLDAPAGAGLPPTTAGTHSSANSLSNFEKLQADWKQEAASRGEESLARLYRLSAAEYRLHTPMTEENRKRSSEDLPLRSSTQYTEAQESVIDLDDANFDQRLNFDFVDATTLKARKSRRISTQDDFEEDDDQYDNRSDNDADKRATMEWTFPTTKKASPKRATMDWTFASARPAEPEEPEAKADLPPLEEDDPPPASRPTLKHTQTMPLGKVRDYIHTVEPFRPATSPIRDSVGSMIDLDLSNVTGADLERPGTAVSTTSSHFTDMTSGNPFDLEEDPGQNELDRNRFSYHKQWQSEGGNLDRQSRRSIPMHTRGSSLSSTDNELERRSNGLRYHLNEPNTAKSLTTAGDDGLDLDSWPNFDQPGIERVSSHDHDVVHVRQQSSIASHTNGKAGPRKLPFPAVVGPRSAALEEHASPALLTAELESLCGSLAESLKATARAFEMHAGLEEEDVSMSESESHFEQSASES